MYAWGVDLKAGGVALAVVRFDAGLPTRFMSAREGYAKAPKKGAKVEPVPRFAFVRDECEVFAAVLGEFYPPAIILVENPVGRRRVPTLVGAWGIACAAFHAHADARVVSLSARQWRAKLGLPTLKGDAKGPSLAFATSIGVPPRMSEDIHEAAAMAAAAGRMF